jgi:hypothetical protein
MHTLILNAMAPKCYFKTAIFVVILAVCPSLFAEPHPGETNSYLPEYYPAYFNHSGLVTNIDKTNHQLVFGLVRIPYDPNVQVSTLASQFGTVDSIRAGDEIGYETVRDNGQSRIIRIWQLPSGSVARP